MSSSIIQVTNLSKSYTISHEGRESYTALRDVMAQKAKKIFSFPSFLRGGTTKQSPYKEEFWALKDVSFNIEQGDRVGIIGRNGAGKSTLLKILSRITEPTTGSIKIKGRVASLLEVGTGFHPELTGRENIFLNGAILGMSRVEIKKHFDAIVDFAEVEKFLDTPVKRYSSGMYVRLAFAVAAHLEPEILIVDEVLAVGDTEFQKKCLGKMQDVSTNEGRTVLFVSHNLAAIREICNTGILLKNGEVNECGLIKNVVEQYISHAQNASSRKYVSTASNDIYIEEITICDIECHEMNSFDFHEQIIIKLSIKDNIKTRPFKVGIAILDSNGSKIFTSHALNFLSGKNRYEIKVLIPSQTLLTGSYSLDAAVFIPLGETFDYAKDQCIFTVSDVQSELAKYSGADIGKVHIPCKWEVS